MLTRRQPPLPKIADRLEPVNQAAERLGVSRDTVIRYIGDNKLRGTMSRPLMVNSADVTQMIKERCREAGAE